MIQQQTKGKHLHTDLVQFVLHYKSKASLIFQFLFEVFYLVLK